MKYLSLILLILITVIASSCRKDLKRMMLVTTDSIYKSDSTINVVGTVIDEGEGIVSYGHCWSLKPLPVISDDTSFRGSVHHTGSFTSKLKNLKRGQTYYVRAYAKHNNEISYGKPLHFLYELSAVSIGPVIQLNTDSIQVNTALTLKASDKVNSYGVCWKLGNGAPTIQDAHSDYLVLPGTTSVNTYLHDFLPGKLYGIRTYAVINAGVFYSDVRMVTTGSLIFRNKLGSPAEIQESNPGPALQTITYNSANLAKYLPAKFGNGLFLNQDTSEGWSNKGANFFAIYTSDIKLSAKCGTIEFWFIFKCSSTIFNQAFFFDFAKQLTDHFSTNVMNTNTYLSGGWYGWGRSESQKNFFFTIKDANTNAEVTIRSTDLIKFHAGDTCHFAFAWDNNGIGGTQETMRIYMNGSIIASTSKDLGFTGTLDPYMYLGAKPGYDILDQTFNAVQGITDNLKIYNFAKVSYSDRGRE